MENKPLVSIIVPCYNGEKVVGRMMDSVIAQTYRPIELIIIDDGSTDNSAAVIKDYEAAFKNADITFKYFYQENQGLGGAINTGLKKFNGEYFCWPDVDDFLEENSIKHRVEFLESHPEYAVVTSDAYVVYPEALDNKEKREATNIKNKEDENQFWHLLVGESIFCAGCHMVRTKEFLEVNPTRSIYPARRGQNWQMLLPLYYRFKRYFLKEPLYNYVVHPNSMSKDVSLEQQLYRCREHETIIFETLSTMDMKEEDFKKADKLVSTLYAQKKMHLYAKSKLYKKACEQYKILCRLHEASFRDWCVSHLRIYHLLRK